MAILHKNISAEGDIHNPKWFSGANNGDVAWRNELGVLESTDELVLPAALNFVDGSVAPPTSNSGDIYVLSSGASVNAGWGTVALGDWVRYDGTTWNVITPQKSTLCYNETLDKLFSYSGSVWAEVGGGGGGGNTIYTANDTIGTGRIATITDTLTFKDGSVNIQGAGTSTGSALSIYDNDTTPNKLWDFLDNGNVNLGVDSVVNLNNTLKIEGGKTYVDSGGFNPLVINRKALGTVGNGVDFNAYNTSNVETNFARIIQVATDATAGIEDGGLWFRVSDNGTITTKMEVNSNTIKFNSLPTTVASITAGEIWQKNGYLRIGTGSGVTLYEVDGSLIEDRTVNLNGNSLTFEGGQTRIHSGGFNPLIINRKSSGATGVGFDLNAYNSSNVEHNFARIVQVATDVTAGSEDGSLWLRVSNNGTITTKMIIKSNTINMSLPTSSTGLSSGDLYNDGGTVKIA